MTIDGREIAIRYAWQVTERGGLRRVFVAGRAITLANPAVRSTGRFVHVPGTARRRER